MAEAAARVALWREEEQEGGRSRRERRGGGGGGARQDGRVVSSCETKKKATRSRTPREADFNCRLPPQCVPRVVCRR